ncbi:MAG: GNAT family N-acetyltransferase [Magnetovibrio sp.]|nr:GNAT family N-acetyltransferase [Magnetovibrio sp.]
MYTIREATHKDWPGIWTIFKDVVSSGDTYPFAPNMTQQEAQEAWLNAPKVTFVAMLGEDVVATYYLKDNQPGLGAHVCNAGYMVRKDQRGQGLGASLCKHSLAAARILGYKAMQYNLVVSTNVGAIGLWKKLGFDIIGTLPKAFCHVKHGLVDAYIMYQILENEDVNPV